MDDEAQQDAERLRRFTTWAQKTGFRVTVTQGPGSVSIKVEKPDHANCRWREIASVNGANGHEAIRKLTIPKTQ